MARRILAALAAACALVVAGCASTPPPAPPFPTAAAEAPTAAPSEAPSDDPAPACADTDAEQALADALPQMPPPFPPDDENMSDVQWDTEHADLEGYDPCAELSWITISIVGGTGSSPSQVALFHAGEFVQAATEKSYGFWPQVTRRRPTRSRSSTSGRSPEKAMRSAAESRPCASRGTTRADPCSSRATRRTTSEDGRGGGRGRIA